jgi:hypothetical protein
MWLIVGGAQIRLKRRFLVAAANANWVKTFGGCKFYLGKGRQVDTPVDWLLEWTWGPPPEIQGRNSGPPLESPKIQLMYFWEDSNIIESSKNKFQSRARQHSDNLDRFLFSYSLHGTKASSLLNELNSVPRRTIHCIIAHAHLLLHLHSASGRLSKPKFRILLTSN